MSVKLLLTNDDGYYSEGLQTLKSYLKELGEVWVVAPYKERSTTSHSMTLNRAVELRKVEEREYISDGTPVDCVYLALNVVLKGRPPSMVISGINRGANLGTDIYYSGTVAAAREAALKGIPSVAISLVEGRDFKRAAYYSKQIIEELLKLKIPRGVFFNINIPGGRDIKGIRITKPGVRHYPQVASLVKKEDSKEYYILGGGLPVEDGDKEDTDGYWTNRFWITITPLSIDISIYKEMIPGLDRLTTMVEL